MIALLNDGKDILENHTIELPEDINDLTKLAESGGYYRSSCTC